MNLVVSDITFNFEVSDESFSISTEEQIELTNQTIDSVFAIDDDSDDAYDDLCNVISDHTGWLVDSVSFYVM